MDARCARDDGLPRWPFSRSANASPASPVYAIYDVTNYAPLHPGSSALLLDAAAREDASELFGRGRHSPSARKLLQTLVVPGLDAVPSASCRRRRDGARASWASLVPRRRDVQRALRDFAGLAAAASLVPLCVHPAWMVLGTLFFPWWGILVSAVLPQTQLWQRVAVTSSSSYQY